jgi:hypothetical protein
MNLLVPFYWSFGVNVTYFALEVVPRHDDCVLVPGELAEVTPEGKLVKPGTNHIIVSRLKMPKTVQVHVDFVSVPM